MKLLAAVLLFFLHCYCVPARAQNQPMALMCHTQFQTYVLHYAWTRHGTEGRNQALTMYSTQVRADETSECYELGNMEFQTATILFEVSNIDEAGKVFTLYMYEVQTLWGEFMFMLTNKPVTVVFPPSVLSFGLSRPTTTIHDYRLDQ